MNWTAKNLAALMEAREISANALADATGTNQPTITRILNSESGEPRDSTLAPLAAFFGLTIHQLKCTPPDKVVALSSGHVSAEDVTPDEIQPDLAQEHLQIFAALGTLMRWLALTRPAEAPLLRAGLEEAVENLAENGSPTRRLEALIAALPSEALIFPRLATPSQSS